MTSLGETLRRERERRHLSLDQVSRELKIAPRFLEAIESEQFDLLPGGVFAKSFVRQYARMLELDEEEAAAEIERILAPPPLPQLSEGAPQAAPPAMHAFSPRVDSISTRRFGSSSWISALAMVIAVTVGCSLVYAWWQRDRRQASTAAAAPHAAAAVTTENTVQPAATPTAATTSSAIPALVTASAPDAASQPPAEDQSVAQPQAQAQSAAEVKDDPANSPITQAATVPKGSGPVKVEILAEEPVWVLARTDGKYAFSGTLEANETRVVQADETILLRLGNAGGVTITLNGKALPAIGPKGQVRTVQLTSGGFQIVAPPKPASPDGLL
jgi:cytoskeleton protein RodZ